MGLGHFCQKEFLAFFILNIPLLSLEHPEVSESWCCDPCASAVAPEPLCETKSCVLGV